MSPTAVSTPATPELFDNIALKKMNGTANGTSYEDKVCEDYAGNYQFAPIEEAEVSRAMIRRYASS